MAWMCKNLAMKTLEFVRKLQTVIAKYDANTAMTALEIAKLLLNHRGIAELDFKRHELNEPDDSQSV